MVGWAMVVVVGGGVVMLVAVVVGMIARCSFVYPRCNYSSSTTTTAE